MVETTRTRRQPEPPVICGKDDEDLVDHCDVHVVDPERVTAVRARLVTSKVAGQMATVFKVLADQSRCRLMAAIIEAGELCVCDLAATVDMSESNVSHHLRVLRANGLVRARRAGKMVFYAPDDAHIRLLLDITREHVEQAARDVRLDRVDAVEPQQLVTDLVHTAAALRRAREEQRHLESPLRHDRSPPERSSGPCSTCSRVMSSSRRMCASSGA